MEKAERSKRNSLGFGIIILMPFFYFVPYYASFDFVPDFIGWLFMLIALRKLRDINDLLCNSFEKFKYLFVSSILKFASIFLIFGFIPASDRSTAMLLFAFAFGLVDVIFGTVAWNSLFAGLTVCEGTNGGNALSGKKSVESARKFTLFFLYAKNALAVIPEFSILSAHKYDDSAFKWDNFTELFRSLAIILCTILGLIWLVKILICFVKIKNDKALFEGAAKEYEEQIGQKPGVLITRKINKALLVGVIGAFLALDLMIDNVNVLPDWLCAIAFLLGFIMLKKFSSKWKIGAISSVIFAIFSVIGTQGIYKFHQNYEDSQVQITPEAYKEFMKYYPFECIANLLCGLTLVLWLVVLSDIIKNNCGYISKNTSDEYSQSRLKAIRHSLYIYLNVAFFTIIFASLTSALYPYVTTYNTTFTNASVFIAAVFTFINACFFIKMSFEIRSEVVSKYMLD